MGQRVVRGPDWKWGEQDGGEGNVGTVIEVKQAKELTSDSSAAPGYVATVCWDTGVCKDYRCGLSQQFELRLFDNGQIGEPAMFHLFFLHHNDSYLQALLAATDVYEVNYRHTQVGKIN